MKHPIFSLRHATRVLPLCAAAAALSWATPVAAQPTGVSDFDVRIPPAPGNFGISHVGGLVTFTDDPGTATVTITNPHGVGCTLSATAGAAPVAETFDPANAACSGGSAQPINDLATFSAPAAALPAGDPQGFRYRFDLFPLSNLDFGTPGICPDTSGGNDDWTVAIDDPGLTAASVCLISFDLSVPAAECAAAEQEIDSANPAEVASVFVNGQPVTQLCGDLRPATDVVLVLDRSGSMDSSTLGSASRPKFAALRDAVSDFVGEWSALRSLEASPPADNIGLVFFDSDEEVAAGLGGFAATNGGVLGETEAECDGPSNTDCSGGTSMGDGLNAAVAQLFPGNAGHRKAIVVMSDGKENTATRVTVDDTVNPTEVLLWDTAPTTTTPLFGTGQDASIYSVTVGTSTAVSADLNEDIARATGGFYINTEDDQEFLRPFFLEVLENAVRFNSWQTLRLASGVVETQAALDVPFPVSTTTRAMSVTLMWDQAQGALDATLLPPGYAEADALTGTAGAGSIRFSLPLPLTDPSVSPDQDWVLRVRAAGVDGGADDPLRRAIPFHVSVTGDDHGLHGQLAIAPDNYEPGDEILVTARITNPEVLTDFGAAPRVEAQILQPGEPIGNVIAASDAPGDPSGDDPGTAADAKLQAILAETPDALTIDTNTVTLVDDGTGGDATAGDGVFSGIVTAEAPGHYTALISVEGQSTRSGRFSREAQRSVHVRSTPQEVDTGVPAVSSAGGVTQVVLTFTPTTAFGHAMPGFAPYLPVTADGIAPVIPRDNLDGSYTSTLEFPGEPADDIAINWIESSANLNGVAPADLPITQNGRVIATGFTLPSSTVPGGSMVSYLLMIVLLLLLLIVAIRNFLAS